MSFSNISEMVKNRLDIIEGLFNLQEEKGANDIRRRIIMDEIVEIERAMTEARRRNQST